MPRAQQPPPPTLDAADLQAPDSVNDVLLDAAVTAEPKPKGKLNIDDYRRLNRRATQNGMYAGVFGGGGLTFLASRFGVTKNGLALTFLRASKAEKKELTPVSATGISFFTTRSIIHESLGEHYSALRAQREPKAPGGGAYLPDTAGGDETISAKEKEELTPRDRLREELLGLGKQPRERTHWAKGRGLDGEVEEEAEMRDTYLRPGVPRT